MCLVATVVPASQVPWIVLVAIAACLGASVAVYWTLVYRWTAHRSWIEIVQWGRARGLHAQLESPTLPAAFAELADKQVSVLARLQGKSTTFIQIQTGDAPAARRWNALIRTIDQDWKPTALRPTPAQDTLLDLFSLTSFPLMGETLRFTVYGTDSTTARRLSKSHARALLPPDIGLLLHGPHLILDFSTRPFDPIAFERMTALADQLIHHLPRV